MAFSNRSIYSVVVGADYIAAADYTVVVDYMVGNVEKKDIAEDTRPVQIVGKPAAYRDFVVPVPPVGEES
jgi:hypothetical protein